MKIFNLINSNWLKIIACLLMVVDHLGYFLFPKIVIFRIIGRLALPIFGYQLALGCRYTHDKLLHFITLFSVAMLCQIVYFFVDPGTFAMSILMTFSFSVIMIYALSFMKKCLFNECKAELKVFSVLAFISSVFFTYLCSLVFELDYGFFGALFPVIISLGDCTMIAKTEKNLKAIEVIQGKWITLLLTAISLVILSLFFHMDFDNVNIQWYCLLSLVILLFASGEKGKLKMKYFFYIFYPVHLALLQAIAWII